MSPLPWTADINCQLHDADVVRDARGVFVARGGSRTEPFSGTPCEPHNAGDIEFIVTAVNAHAALVEALKECIGWIDPDADDLVNRDDARAALAMAEAALQLAGVETK